MTTTSSTLTGCASDILFFNCGEKVGDFHSDEYSCEVISVKENLLRTNTEEYNVFTIFHVNV
jgi:hypothetical protein